MIARITGAALRGLLVALMLAAPALLLPAGATASPEIVVFIALLAGTLTFAEYFPRFPSVVEFREAPPFNRMRFAACAVTLGLLSLLAAHPLAPTGLTALVQQLAARLGAAMNFAYSPVQLATLMMPPQAAAETVLAVRNASGLASMVAIAAIALFALVIRIGQWPVGQGAFNVWVNLPLFDPTTGADVVQRLQRDGRINVIAGILLPFAVPAAVTLSAGFVDPALLAAPHVLVWSVTAWALVPASMIMRGMAMLRIAALIAQQRRAAHRAAEALQTA
ncbi:hypothetical protein [Cribrihabitans neustonicus]|uniref:hypothetical protein n=1 Tax=Cribrihabitans neustonicus TaxID=1429085 RepID=UPI003B5C6D95